MNNKLKKKSPFKWWQVAIAALGYLEQRKQQKRARREMRAQQAKHDKRMKAYEALEFQPIDPSIADQENIFEDMEIDTTGFEMQRKAFLQQQANIMQGLQMVGGTSGAAGLAQALSGAADKQTEQMGMTVTQMINRAKELKRGEQGRINQNITNIKLANAEGARQFEIDKLTTMLGVEGQKVAGARQGVANANQSMNQYISTVGSITGSYYGAGGSFNFGGGGGGFSGGGGYTVSGSGVDNINPLYQSPIE
jgi:hypothetical protein